MIKLAGNDVLLFQGDSITHGGRVYSDWDMNHIMGHGYQSILASKIGLDNIDTRPEIINRGVSGDSASGILNRMQADILDLKPTVLSLLVGINDCNCFIDCGRNSPEDYDKNVRAILDAARAQNPALKIIIGEPFHFTCIKDDDTPEKIKREELFTEKSFIYAEKAKNIAADYGAAFVEYRCEFEKRLDSVPLRHLVWDGVHPTYVGHQIMADKWYSVVEKFLG